MPHNLPPLPLAKILIVDDQDAKRLALRATLEPLGQEIVAVDSGREALRTLLQHDYAVILLDVRMPEMDGFETAELIRSRRQSEATPIIFVTAHDRAEADMLRGYTLGAVDFIFSPFQAEVLRAKVNVFVELHRQTQTVRAQERRLRELEALQARHELLKLSSALEQSADPVLIADQAGRVEYVNSAFSAVSGLTPEELLGRRLGDPETGETADTGTDGPAPGSAANDPAGMWATLRRGEVFRGEFIHRRPGGEDSHEERTVTPIRDPAGQITHFVSTGRDVTDRKRMEAQLLALNASLEERVRERTAQLEDVNGELEAYAYSISHDLRTPLRHIGSFADLLARSSKGQLSESAGRYLQIIQDGARRMEELIDGLLDFARTGRHELRPQRIDLGAVVSEVARELSRVPGAAAVTWEIADLPEVQADLLSVRQVIVNLLSNAVKYSQDQPGGPRVEVWASQEEGGHVIHVRDNGVGFNMAYSHKLFTVFQRLHPAEAFEGHGVGLAHVKRIVARHGGRVWAHSAEGEGATFSFSLPPWEDVGAGAAEAEPGEAGPGEAGPNEPQPGELQIGELQPAETAPEAEVG